ncbi:MAG: aldehyde dehydrogenase [Bacteroidia bacterium]|nr:aldehyde dehydrogenase [Bacteroidia bacterium]
MNEAGVSQILANQRAFFNTHQTKDVFYRIAILKLLKKTILDYQEKIEEALWKDLHKSKEETFLTEIGLVLHEIDFHIKNVSHWAKPKKVSTPFFMLPSGSKTKADPLGIALIIAPWNYPFQLLINPLVGAISAGCCAVLKPSPDAPHLAKVMEDMVSSIFEPNYIGLVQGGKEENELLLKQKFDIIFFTGSSAVGKVIMRAAAENLTPVVLELGGKSPVLVNKDADIPKAAKRIIWGKTINAGQTCIAPDYLFVHSEVKNKLLEEMDKSLEDMFGSDRKKSGYYGRIIHERAFDRLIKLMAKGKARIGGETEKADLYIAPTVLEGLGLEDDIMQEEIFGPILPLFEFSDFEQVINFVNSKEKPLAIYYFGNAESVEELMHKTSSGGVCINDTLMHVSNQHLPFGGVGNSGMGSYHGANSFWAFSHKKSIVTTPTWIDLPFKYMPFKHFKWVKKMI